MKNVLIAGPMRSGKTLIARHLSDAFLHIETDYIILALQRAYPQTGVGRRGASYDELCAAFVPFLSVYATQLGSNLKTRYVLDCHYIRPQDTLSLPNSFRTIFVGYPEISMKEKVLQIREYGRFNDCYTNTISDDRLESFVASWIDQSRRFREECHRLDIPFFDTSSGIEACVSYLHPKSAEQIVPADQRGSPPFSLESTLSIRPAGY